MYAFWQVLSSLAGSPLVGFLIMVAVAVAVGVVVVHINERRSKRNG